MAGGEVAQGFLEVALGEQQVVGVFQRHVGADLAQRLQRGGDVGLRLVAEEAFVAGLAERGGGIDDGLGEGVVGNAPVGREIVGVPRLPACAARLRAAPGGG